MRRLLLSLARSALLLPLACGDGQDGDNTEADKLGVGAQCQSDADCNPDDADTDGVQDQSCLPQFAGGYCGVQGCGSNADCPEGSACVTHTDGVNYCFRICTDKAECNANRNPDVESNCSANIVFTDGGQGFKACVPPSSGA